MISFHLTKLKAKFVNIHSNELYLKLYYEQLKLYRNKDLYSFPSVSEQSVVFWACIRSVEQAN